MFDCYINAPIGFDPITRPKNLIFINESILYAILWLSAQTQKANKVIRFYGMLLTLSYIRSCIRWLLLSFDDSKGRSGFVASKSPSKRQRQFLRSLEATGLVTKCLRVPECSVKRRVCHIQPFLD